MYQVARIDRTGSKIIEGIAGRSGGQVITTMVLRKHQLSRQVREYF